MPDTSTPTPEHRGLRIEVVVVLAVTFGYSGLSAALSLVQELLTAGGLADRRVALNPSRSDLPILELLWQLLRIVELGGWAALGLYLLLRGGIRPRTVGLDTTKLRRDVLHGLSLAALIGLPGLGLYLIAHNLGLSVTLIPSSLNDHWWRTPVLIGTAAANALAEEVIVVGYLLTRLRQLGWSEKSALSASSLLRGSYHLYQGLGGGLGNLVMGLVFGKYWQLKGGLWPLVIAHTVIDSIAYLGYQILHNSVTWLP